MPLSLSISRINHTNRSKKTQFPEHTGDFLNSLTDDEKGISFVSTLNSYMTVTIHPSWHMVLANEFEKPYWNILTEFLKEEYASTRCFPEWRNIFRAFDSTPFDQVKVVILGQDPYHTLGAAMGLSFSIPDGSKAQPSLRNIFRELESDMGIKRTHTDLTDWAEQGVLLLNAVLTVREGEAASHQ